MAGQRKKNAFEFLLQLLILSQKHILGVKKVVWDGLDVVWGVSTDPHHEHQHPQVKDTVNWPNLRMHTFRKTTVSCQLRNVGQIQNRLCRGCRKVYPIENDQNKILCAIDGCNDQTAFEEKQ